MKADRILGNIEQWKVAFERALTAKNPEGLKSLLTEVSYFRDHGALTWDLRQFHGRDAVVATLLAVVDEIKPHSFKVSAKWPAPQISGAGEEALIEAFFDFETAHGRAEAYVHCKLDPTSQIGIRAYAIFTRLEGLKDVVLPEGHPRDQGYTPNFSGELWRENRDTARQFINHDPEVLIVGAGQAGMIPAAYLNQMGVSTLLVDRNERVGDNWYKRYGQLNLHNPVEMNGFPFLPFPKHYPEYLPKDLIGDWLDTYAQYLDLNIWTSTSFKGAQYDEAAQCWTATLQMKDGSERVMRPRHIILATGGIGGKPNVPSLKGLESFKGKVVHSTQYNKAADYGAKKAIVVGCGASGHDISVDLYRAGVAVTMLQRDPIVVNHIDTANLAYIDYINPALPTELVDFRYGINMISPMREAGSRKYHQFAKARDAELLKGLEAAGMRLNDGFEGMGWFDLFLRFGGGYYLNKCTSEIIVEGGIKVEQIANVDTFASAGAQRIDGSVLEADLVVLATGYQNRQVEVAEWFGNDVAERVGKIAVLDTDGEWANVWGQTGQQGLWFNGGGINQVRSYSERLTLLIKADLSGHIPKGFRRPPKNSSEKAVCDSARSVG